METTTKKNTTKKDSFIEKIIENLDLVSAKDWEFYSDLSAIYPTNLFSKKRYNGFNVISLYLDTMVKNFKSSKYATFNSISKAGGKLKKGSKGCVIEFFSYIFKDKETGKIISDEQMKFLSLEQRKNLLILHNFMKVEGQDWAEDLKKRLKNKLSSFKIILNQQN